MSAQTAPTAQAEAAAIVEELGFLMIGKTATSY